LSISSLSVASICNRPLLPSFLSHTAYLYQVSGDAVLDPLENLRKATIGFIVSVRLSVRPYGTIQLPLEGYSRNFMFTYFSKNFPKN
jgi:hypothetical protein